MTRFRQRSVSAMTHSAFLTASSYTAEQPAPKNPATSESLTGVTVLGFHKSAFNMGRGALRLVTDISGFRLANQAANY